MLVSHACIVDACHISGMCQVGWKQACVSAANTANQSVDHRPIVLEAAPQYKRYLSPIANCPNVGNYAQDPVGSIDKHWKSVCTQLVCV